MRTVSICAALGLALAAPAFADTLKDVTTKGIILTISDGAVVIDVTPKADGTYVAKIVGIDGEIPGKWRTDGDKFCTSSEATPEECVTYPKDKKSGDTFEVTSSQGKATVKIK
jgi:hypothetical protein